MIKHRKGACIDCQRETLLIAKRCNNCYWKSRRETKCNPEKTPRKPKYILPKVSTKRKAQNTLYRKKRLTFMEQNKLCKARLDGCTKSATEVHHKKGRINNLLTDERYFLPVCRSCHQVIELNPVLAKELGFSQSRLNVGE
ncbi:hypothetical protein DC487_01175 [Sphingobacterium corticibacter]|uniref:Uncharacterized protein n=1 Tax=Sphingobacterium corticibacter TaxID=2171749 RepID=A0A2T8HLG5_9SPHI|nr:hypothetical protein DC487_01175 [Sphingobacterium corticibacter]